MEQIKLHWSNVEEIKSFMTLQVDTYDDGVSLFITDLNKIVFKKASSKFDIPNTETGTLNKSGGVADTIFKNRQVMVLNLDRNVYGVRTKIMAGPLWSDDETEILGVWVIAIPRTHPLARSFSQFAPTIANILPEGGFMYITDKEKFAYRQGSPKFDAPNLQVGVALKEGDLAVEVMRTGKVITKDIPRTVWGKDAQVSCYPLVDEETKEIVGSFGLAMPRELAFELKEMAANLGRGLTEVSAAMEEMAASASEVSQNQIVLNREIDIVRKNANEINEVLTFIKQIADETKMLGLNAAIEAARAGEAGRGFGVVAEEIRKLSDQSKQTVVQIKELLDRVQGSVHNTVKLSDATLSTTEQVAAATEEVNASVEEMSSLAEQLDSTAAKL